MTINISRLARHADYLNKVANLNGGKFFRSKDALDLRKEYSAAGGTFTAAIKLGYFVSTTRGFYKPTVVHFEPKHARMVLETIGDYHSKYIQGGKKKVSKKKKVEQAHKESVNFIGDQQDMPKQLSTVKDSYKHTGTAKVSNKPFSGSVKTFSLFWGLIKFNY